LGFIKIKILLLKFLISKSGNGSKSLALGGDFSFYNFCVENKNNISIHTISYINGILVVTFPCAQQILDFANNINPNYKTLEKVL